MSPTTSRSNELVLLPLERVAEILSLSLHTVRRWASQRRIPTTRVGRRVLVREADLRRFIDEHSQDARSDIGA